MTSEIDVRRLALAAILRLRSGERIVTCDEILDAIQDLDDDFAARISSVHNRNRVGVKDQYIAWVGDTARPPDIGLNLETMASSATL
jgi:hypothetical protein